MLACHSAVDSLLSLLQEMWKDLYNNPGSWYDNRADVVGTNRPDFKHKQSGKGLWLRCVRACVRVCFCPSTLMTAS